jgi:hypothetical protein
VKSIINDRMVLLPSEITGSVRGDGSNPGGVHARVKAHSARTRGQTTLGFKAFTDKPENGLPIGVVEQKITNVRRAVPVMASRYAIPEICQFPDFAAAGIGLAAATGVGLGRTRRRMGSGNQAVSITL